MSEFAHADDRRDAWLAATSVALASASRDVRKRMAARLDKNIPARARSVYRASWWDRALDAIVAPAFAAITAQVALDFYRGLDVERDDQALVNAAAVATGAALAQLVDRGQIIADRVAELHAQAVKEGWSARQLRQALGVDSPSTPGPMSRATTDAIAVSSSTSLIEGTTHALATELKIDGQKRWVCSFRNSRETHIKAHDQEVALGKKFTVGGYPARFPGDPLLPVEEVANCRCSVFYLVEDAAADELGALAAAATPAPEPARPVQLTARGADMTTTTQLAPTTFAINEAQVLITVEPTAAEKNLLAVPGGDPAAELHVPLAALDGVDLNDESLRVALTSAIAGVASTIAPLSGNVSGQLRQQDSVGVLVHADGLGALRSELAAAVAAVVGDARYDEFIPVLMLGTGDLDVSGRDDVPVHFNEIRVRWAGETRAFDLLGPLPEAPTLDDPVDATQETAMAANTFAPEDEAPEMPPGPDKSPEADLAGASDDDLVAELARRIAEQAAPEEADAESLVPEAEDDLRAAIDEVTRDLTAEQDDKPADEDSEDGPPAVAAAAAVAEEAAPADAETAADYEWEGVLVVTETLSGDGRKIAADALTWRNLPLPLMLQTETQPGHLGAKLCGTIDAVEQQGNSVIGRGRFNNDEDGVRARELVTSGKLRGVSVDMDSVEVIYTTESGDELDPSDEDDIEQLLFDDSVVALFVAGRIMGATLCPFPAFQEAQVGPVGSLVIEDVAEDALVASGAEGLSFIRVTSPAHFAIAGATSMEALVASAAGPDPDAPPADWFDAKPMDEPEPFTVHADGRCYGLIAQWGTCHIGFKGQCVTVPKSTDFRSFYTGKKVLTREGTLVSTGPIVMDTVHPNLRKKASDAQAFYAETGCAAADVRLHANEHGIVAAGALRPDVDQLRARRLRGSDVSPDWRSVGGELRIVALLAVNASGFLVEGIAASAGEVRPFVHVDSTETPTALVAAGAIRRAPSVRRTDAAVEELAQRVSALEAENAEMRQAFTALSTRHRSKAERRALASDARARLGVGA